MNPRLSIQGRMSLDGWTGVGDRESIDLRPEGSVRGSRHNRQNSIYRSQTTNLFNTFETPDGDVALNPVSPQNTTSRHHPHRTQPDVNLHELREADEWEQNNDYLDDDHDIDDERTALRKGRARKGDNSQLQTTTSSTGHKNISPSRNGDIIGQRADGRLPSHNSSSTDVRIP